MPSTPPPQTSWISLLHTAPPATDGGPTSQKTRAPRSRTRAPLGL